MLVFLCLYSKILSQSSPVRFCLARANQYSPTDHAGASWGRHQNPLTNNLQIKFGSIKIIVVYLYPKLNTMKIKSFSIEKEYNRKGEPHKHKNKMYIFPSGETLLENLENRRSRPYQVYKKEVIPMLMTKLEKKYPQHYKELKEAKWSWNKNCGCSSCPCSPGFVSDILGAYSIQIEITD